MTELFDMGKYNFYVWGSVIVFFVAILADFISVQKQNKHIKRLIKSKLMKKAQRKKQA